MISSITKLLLLFLLLNISFINLTYAAETLPALEIKEIAPEIYQHTSFENVEGFGLVSSNGLVVVEQGKAFIIDSPWSEHDTKVLVTWIKKQGYQLVGSVHTHSHDDRSAGIHWLNMQKIPTYASTLTNELLNKANKTMATHSFSANTFDLFNNNIQAFYPGGGHTIDNLVVWIPKANVLLGGCFIRSLSSKNLGYVGEAKIDQWAASVEKVIVKYPNAQIVIPGHGELGDHSLLEHTKKLANAVLAE